MRLRLIAARDVAALKALYDRHARAVYSLIVRIVREPSLADEVLQDTFWQVWQQVHAFAGTAYVVITTGVTLPDTGAASNITLGLGAGLAMILLALAVRTSLAASTRAARTR